jgi:hypothetical protein
MGTPEDLNRLTAEEWRELGFFYMRDDAASEWIISGSRDGLLRFRDLLSAYASDPRNAMTSEHQHYGPYTYLTIMTWPQPEITREGIRGPLLELRGLANRIGTAVEGARVGEMLRIGKTFAPASPYELVLILRDPGFDPASVDESCTSEESGAVIPDWWRKPLLRTA